MHPPTKPQHDTSHKKEPKDDQKQNLVIMPRARAAAAKKAPAKSAPKKVAKKAAPAKKAATKKKEPKDEPKRKRNDKQKRKEAAERGVVNRTNHEVAGKAGQTSLVDKCEEELKEKLDLRNPQHKKFILSALKKSDDGAKKLPETIKESILKKNKFLRDCVESFSDPSTEPKGDPFIDIQISTLFSHNKRL